MHRSTNSEFEFYRRQIQPQYDQLRADLLEEQRRESERAWAQYRNPRAPIIPPQTDRPTVQQRLQDFENSEQESRITHWSYSHPLGLPHVIKTVQIIIDYYVLRKELRDGVNTGLRASDEIRITGRFIQLTSDNFDAMMSENRYVDMLIQAGRTTGISDMVNALIEAYQRKKHGDFVKDLISDNYFTLTDVLEECPICFNVCYLKIQEHDQRHNICPECSLKVAICPFCRVEI